VNNFQVSKAPDYGKVDTGSAASVGRINMAGISQAAAQQARQGGGGLGAAMLAAGGAALGEGARRGAEANAAEIKLWSREHEVQLELKKQAAMEAMKEQAAEASSAREQEQWEKRAGITQEQALERARVSNDFDVEREGRKEASGKALKSVSAVYAKNPEAVETVHRIATEAGVDPAVMLSVWGQESGYSTNTKMKGVELSKGRGRAVGPFQVVPHYHPDFPIDGTFEEQAKYAAKYLAEVGVEGYYGKGKAPDGHPTTKQYGGSVADRANAWNEFYASRADGVGGMMAKSEKAQATDPLQAKLDAAGVKTPAEGTKAPGAQTKEAATADGEESGGLMKKTAKTVLGANKAVVEAIGGGLEKARQMGATVGDLMRGEDPKEPGKLASKVWNEVLKASGTDQTKAMIDGKEWTLKDFVEELLKRNPDAPVAKVVEQAAKNWKTVTSFGTGGRI
jgi:hypothetical protein